MSEPEFRAEPVNLSDLAEAIEALDDAERLIAVDAWSRANDEIGRGSSGWVTHFVTQRTGELNRERFIELGPVSELRPVEVQGFADLCRDMARGTLSGVHTTPALSRYWSECSTLFSERVIRPGGQAV